MIKKILKIINLLNTQNDCADFDVWIDCYDKAKENINREKIPGSPDKTPGGGR